MTIKPIVDCKSPERIAPREASRITGLTPKQLGRMADDGRLNATRPGGTQRRYLRAQIEALVAPAPHSTVETS